MSKRIFLTILLLFSVTAFAEQIQVTKFLDNLANTTLSIIQDKKSDEKEKTKKLEVLFMNSLDVEWMSKFVLGRYYKDIATDKEKFKKYSNTYIEFLLATYVPHFKKYTGETFRIISVTTSGPDEFLADTEIDRPGNSPIKIDYRIRKKSNNQLVIYDIIAEGVSLITTQRSDFGAVLSSGSLDNLIDQLQNKLQELKN